jgi:hypothetical protein
MSRCGTCGHLREAHTHFRRGSDCSQCYCMGFVSPALAAWRDIVDWVGARFRRG